VEIVAEGDMETLAELTGWLQTGPPNAKVKKVSIEWDEISTNEFSSFKIHK
jgi:acylphosphatase